jgi:hypothetical protein
MSCLQWGGEKTLINNTQDTEQTEAERNMCVEQVLFCVGQLSSIEYSGQLLIHFDKGVPKQIEVQRAVLTREGVQVMGLVSLARKMLDGKPTA